MLMHLFTSFACALFKKYVLQTHTIHPLVMSQRALTGLKTTLDETWKPCLGLIPNMWWVQKQQAKKKIV